MVRALFDLFGLVLRIISLKLKSYLNVLQRVLMSHARHLDNTQMHNRALNLGNIPHWDQFQAF